MILKAFSNLSDSMILKVYIFLAAEISLPLLFWRTWERDIALAGKTECSCLVLRPCQ